MTAEIKITMVYTVYYHAIQHLLSFSVKQTKSLAETLQAAGVGLLALHFSRPGFRDNNGSVVYVPLFLFNGSLNYGC